MKVQVASDLHLEFDKGAPFVLDNTENADVLILAGDIIVAKHIINNIICTYKDFFNNVSQQFEHVLVIAGNHEYYGSSFSKTQLCLSEFYSQYNNVTFLNNSSIAINDVLFIGTTLWTDFNNNCYFTKNHVRRSLNDYFVIDGFTTSKAIDEHYIARQFITDTYKENKDRFEKMVGIFHHGISPQSIHEIYRSGSDTLLNGAYASDMRNFFEDKEKFKLFIHGHTHHSFDYILDNKLQSQRVICNPRGYAKRDENFDFNHNLIVEV
jgi:UDP-2,3-diacylglucosamine pyrophosphatase LpxH